MRNGFLRCFGGADNEIELARIGRRRVRVGGAADEDELTGGAARGGGESLHAEVEAIDFRATARGRALL
jgi:hypothetical protein